MSILQKDTALNELLQKSWRPDWARLMKMSGSQSAQNILNEMKELERRTDYLETKLTKREIKDKAALTEFAMAGFRSEWYHGIGNDKNECLEIQGPHPIHFIQNKDHRQNCWQRDVQDLVDKVSFEYCVVSRRILLT
jgi:U3 small nucleolar RNA-associated protein 14